MKYEISAEDRKILRETAKKQMDFACQERNKILKEKWYLHNALRCSFWARSSSCARCSAC